MISLLAAVILASTPPPAAPATTLTIAIAGRGTVTTPVGSCTSGGEAASCTHSFAAGGRVALTAKPAAGGAFDGWSGDCSGAAGCTLTMTASRSVTATFVDGTAQTSPRAALALKGLSPPKVDRAGASSAVLLRFSSTRAAIGWLQLRLGDKTLWSVWVRARAGANRLGPFLVAGTGRYRLELVLTDQSGTRKTLHWRGCVGACTAAASPSRPAPPPPAATGALRVTRGEAAIVRSVSGASVRLRFTATEAVTVVVSVLRGSKLVLKGLRFSFAAGPASLGPFAISRPGSYSFRVVATDDRGRHASLRWDVTVPAA